MKQYMDDYSLFEQCLSRLEAGEDLETILADNPAEAGKLRPLLTAAVKARCSGAPLRIPASAKIDSRTRFLAEAGRMQKKQHLFDPRLRFAGAAAMVVIVLLAGIFGTGLASAKAVPGQTLYPVKLVVEQAQLALTVDQPTRLNLEEEFDRRRVEETEKLSLAGRSESVTLAGPLNLSTDQTYAVGGVTLNLTPDQEAIANSLAGSYVEVKGNVRGADGLDVEGIELRLFNFSGILNAMSDNEWLVSGVKVMVMETTQITGQPKIGKRVELTTLHYDEEYFLALSVRVTGPAEKENKPLEQKENNGKGKTTLVNQGTAENESSETLSPTQTPEPRNPADNRKPEPTKLLELDDDDNDDDDD